MFKILHYLLLYFALAALAWVLLPDYVSLSREMLLLVVALIFFLPSLIHLILNINADTTNAPISKNFYPNVRNDNISMVDKIGSSKTPIAEPPSPYTVGMRPSLNNNLLNQTSAMMAKASSPSDLKKMKPAIAKAVVNMAAENKPKPVNAVQEILQSAEANPILENFSQLFIYGKPVVNLAGRYLLGHYCFGFLMNDQNQLSVALSNLHQDAPRDVITGDIDILAMQALSYSWQKMLNLEEPPYHFFPLLEKPIAERGYISELRSFLKYLKVSNPAFNKIYRKLVFTLPAGDTQYRYQEDFRSLSDDGFILGLFGDKILERDFTNFISDGYGWLIITATELLELEKIWGVVKLKEKLQDALNSRVQIMVSDINDEFLLERVQGYQLTIGMGKVLSKPTIIGSMPLKPL